MKTRSVSLLGVALIITASAGLAAFTSLAPSQQAELKPMILSNEFILAGEVIARDDAGFTVLGVGSQLTVVQVSSETAILKGAESIRLAEIMVGDKVSATVMRGGDGSLQAVKVEVRTGYE